MSRYPLTNFFRAAFTDALSNDAEAQKIYADWTNSRRKFIRDMALAAGSLAVFPGFSFPNSRKPEVMIVGAGMAGLNAVYQLNKKGISATVFEASARTGGRMFTLRNQFGDGITTDIGGEFVDSTHADLLQLMKEFNLGLYNLQEDELSPKTFYFAGRLMDQSDLRQAISPFAKQIMKDIVLLPPQIDYTTADHFRHLDEQSITEYLNGLGISGWLFDFLNVVLTREYGMEASDQSAVNFLIMFVPPLESDRDYQLFGPGHEVFKIRGGSQHLTDALYESVKKQVVFNHRLTGVKQLDSGRYEMVFAFEKGEKRILADYILMTIPFSILRNISFDLPMPAAKRRCIHEIGYGNSCKFVMGVREKPWRKAGKQGYTFTDLSFGAGWDSSQMQSGSAGSFTVFGGGKFGDYLNESKEALLDEKLTAELDVIYPGANEDFTEKKIKFCWSAYPFTRGGYSAFKKGQWSTLSGWEATPVGNIFFAGEHVSKEFQGYMNGAAETARVAVEAMVKKITDGSL